MAQQRRVRRQMVMQRRRDGNLLARLQIHRFFKNNLAGCVQKNHQIDPEIQQRLIHQIVFDVRRVRAFDKLAGRVPRRPIAGRVEQRREIVGYSGKDAADMRMGVLFLQPNKALQHDAPRRDVQNEQQRQRRDGNDEQGLFS